ncbi:DNA-directed RNA polymerase subunit beta [Halobacillus sp. K22]|uniref:DNA-directed RNA polymerase subunit beta n=1 Tax=Halobacillus sp. K22 TaxID=3457431 RepID=UPI003FCE76FF
MATDPNTNDKKHKREQDREQKRKALDKATKQDDTKKQGYWQKLKKTLSEKTGHKSRIRVLPIWLRIIIVLVLSILALLIGLMVGYGVIGDGNPMEALNWDTWQHIWDIVTKTE